MPTAAPTQTTKKQAPPMRKPATERPHKNLTPMQEEVVDLAAEMILHGGSREEVIPFLASLYRRQNRNSWANTSATPPEGQLESQGLRRAEEAFQDLVRLWPEPFSQAERRR